LLISIISLSIFGQGEANNWYFGNNAGVTFNTNPPSALTDGELNTSEGCSSISDSNGNLLMYTDGRTIWDRNHNIMPNADYFSGSGLNGDPSSTSSGLIVPHPTEPDLYYVFTVDEPHHNNAFAYPIQGPADRFSNRIDTYDDGGIIPRDDDGFNNGLNYSLVDMSLRSGLGDVVPSSKNIQLVTYADSDEDKKYKASEKITAVRGRDCNSVWVITHFKDTYYSFLIDDNGIDVNPEVSQVIPNIPTTSYRRGALGYMKASPIGDKILTAHYSKTFNREDYTDGKDGSVYLYDFDNATGVVSNPIELIGNVNAYSVEFSQDGTKAYAVATDLFQEIFQWDLNSTDIPGSKETITTSTQLFNALQLGPNGKIYHSLDGGSLLGVINNPNRAAEDVNYTQDINQGAISLAGRASAAGLPPFIQSLFSKRIPIVETNGEEVIEQVALCDMYTYELSYDDIPGATYTWSKDGIILNSETGSAVNISVDPTSKFPIKESYRLEVDLNNGECPLIGVAQITFNQSPIYSDGELLTCRIPGEDALYDLTEIRSVLSDQVSLNPDQIEVEIYKNSADVTSGNNPIPLTSNFTNIEDLSSLYVKITSFGVCEDIREFELIAEDLADIDESDEILTYCLEDFPDEITLDPLSSSQDPTRFEFEWSTGETTPTISVNFEDDYFVDVNIKGTSCTSRKSFIITESNIADFNHQVERLGDVSNLVLLVNPSSLGNYEFAINDATNFQDSNLFENLNPGIYTVYVRDKLGCGISEKTVGVLGIMKFFTPNGDGINDLWEISGLLDNTTEDILLQVYDRYGKLLRSFTNADQGWDGTYNGRDLPTNDYWYRIRLTDGTVETGSFTLKR